MPMNERTLNGFIAAAMSRQAPPNYRFTAEQSGAARSGSATPDIVVEMPYGLRTIIETEYGAPAVKDAIARLGYQFNNYNIPMKSVIALGIPRALGELDLDELASREPDAPLMSHKPQFLMQVVTGKSPDDPNPPAVPAKPFPVSLQDVVQYAWLAAIPAPPIAPTLDIGVGSFDAIIPPFPILSQPTVAYNKRIMRTIAGNLHILSRPFCV